MPNTGGTAAVAAVAVQSTAVIPSSFTIEAFDPKVTTWRRWLQRLNGAFTIFHIEKNARVPYFLHYVGPKAFDVLCDRLDPHDPFTKPYEELTAKLGEYYDPVPLEISENFKFHQRRQEKGETVQQFAAALHKLSIYCKFGDYVKTALRNQFVFGLLNKKVQMRLLEKKDLTYEEALAVATKMELSKKSAVSQGARGKLPVEVDYLQRKKSTRKLQFRHLYNFDASP